MDPDGRLVIFVNGLRSPNPFVGNDQSFGQGIKGIYRYNQLGGESSASENAKILRSYWNTGDGANKFGQNVDMAAAFMARIGDDNAYLTSGSSTNTSQSNANWAERYVLGENSRYHEGMAKGEVMHKMIQNGEITLQAGETIKIISHSHGGAHAQGIAAQLLNYKNENGEPLYQIEVIYHITPHQPTDIPELKAPIRTVQYSHPNDAISSTDGLFELFNGGSDYGPIPGITEFIGEDIMGGIGQPDCEGPMGNRCAHSVADNYGFIFETESGNEGAVELKLDRRSNGSTLWYNHDWYPESSD